MPGAVRRRVGRYASINNEVRPLPAELPAGQNTTKGLYRINTEERTETRTNSPRLVTTKCDNQSSNASASLTLPPSVLTATDIALLKLTAFDSCKSRLHRMDNSVEQSLRSEPSIRRLLHGSNRTAAIACDSQKANQEGDEQCVAKSYHFQSKRVLRVYFVYPCASVGNKKSPRNQRKLETRPTPSRKIEQIRTVTRRVEVG